jgi:outer membrane protein assembly factor BamB
LRSPQRDVERLAVQYPGGIAARYRWSSTGGADAVFATSELTGALADYAALAGPAVDPAVACRAEVRVESPTGSWTARLASVVFDEPQGVYWDTHGLLLIKYGFVLYAFGGRTGELAWTRTTGTPQVSVLASARLDHVVLQSELETYALRPDGEVAWRAAHSDVITAAQIVAGRLDLTTYGGQHLYLDARTGEQA